MTIDLSRLAEPFPSEDVEWRVQQSGMKNDNKPWARVLAYVDSRAIQSRLDEVCGPDNWRNEEPRVVQIGQHVAILCGISIRLDGEWVTKWDGAEATDIEAVKGGLSSAFKRAAVLWSIGRYLYDLPSGWAQFNERGHYRAKVENQWLRWDPPPLPKWALPQGTKPQNGAPQQHKPEPEQPSDAQSIKRILWEAGCMTAEQVSLVLSYATDGEYTTAEQAKATPEDAAIVLKRLREHAGGYDLLLGKAQTAQQTRQEEAALNNEEETF